MEEMRLMETAAAAAMAPESSEKMKNVKFKRTKIPRKRNLMQGGMKTGVSVCVSSVYSFTLCIVHVLQCRENVNISTRSPIYKIISVACRMQRATFTTFILHFCVRQNGSRRCVLLFNDFAQMWR